MALFKNCSNGSSPLHNLGHRVLTNSKFGLFYSNFLILTPTFSKVPIEEYGKTPNFSGKQCFYSYFQNPSENSGSHRLKIDFQDDNFKYLLV